MKYITEESDQQAGFTKLIKPKRIGTKAGSVKDKNIGKLTVIRRKIEQLKLLLRPESNLYKALLPKTLEFGHEFILSYKKHGSTGHLKDIIHNKNIRSFVSYNDKHLHVWREHTAQQVMNVNFFDETQSHTISCIVYSSKFMLYFAISTDFKLHIFNEHLIFVGWFPLDARLVHYAYFIEETSTLITAGIDGCFLFKLYIQNKYEPKQAMMLDPEGNWFTAEIGPKQKLQKMPLWIKGLKVVESQNLIFTWSQLKACINNLEGKIVYRFKKLTTYEDYITDVLVSQKYKYFVTATFTGNVIVWKLDKKKEIIH